MPRWPDKTLYERLMEKVKEELDCWIFYGATDKQGYGHLRIKIDGRWRVRSAHKVSYEIHKGEVPEGMVVRHMCDVRNCVNPAHLELGSQKENIRDIILRNRGANQYGKFVGKEYIANQTDDVPF